MTEAIEVGDVIQIMPESEKRGWVGAFLLVTELKSFDVVGFVFMVNNSDEPPGRAYIRLPWKDVERVGAAPAVPKEDE